MNARLLDRFGEGVRPWLAGLPALVADLSARWDLRVERELTGGTSHALLCSRAGEPVVLKVTPEPGIAAEEVAALGAWASSPGVVSVLESDVAAGAVLLEGLVPGTPVTYGPALVGVLETLHVPPPAGFRSLADRVDFMFGLAARRRGRDFSAAHAVAARLARDRVPAVLLHGDLHLLNVLESARGPVVIDPRPCVGDAAFDAVDFAWAAPSPDEGVELLSRVVDGDRLRAWCDVLSVFRPTS
ncbi:aminoglycoside phosphotransferase family protein [Actinosynnema sp. NPDC020468]|uniref:aminoglycoside phosphotransferase family protein n=1 Tax=Actinosynnema sp. NPDC020468 TaxID=3154488 RepID=UPI0033E54183